MSKNKLSPKEREELLKTLNARFEKNMNRHEGLKWTEVQAKLDSPDGGEKLWSLNEMEETGGEPDVVGYDKKQANTFFMIVRQKAPKAAEVFATTGKRLSRERSTSPKTALWMWSPLWELSFLRKNNTGSCSNLATSTQKHRAG